MSVGEVGGATGAPKGAELNASNMVGWLALALRVRARALGEAGAR